jgi:hypothetical protein
MHKVAMMSRRTASAAVSAVVATLLLLAVTACGGDSTGTALDNRTIGQDGLITIRIGTQIGMNAIWLDNFSHTPITIDSVDLVGKGIGTVVRRVGTQVAISGLRSVPVSAYAETPPVALTRRGCIAQALRPLAGYRLMPGKFVTLWTILLGVRPGRYNISSHVITYTQNGIQYRQSITQGFHGIVTRHAPLVTTAGDGSGQCWRHRSHLLKGVPW